MKFLIGLALFFTVLFGWQVVSASQFSSEADKYFEETCSKPKIKGIQAFVCDLRVRLDAISEESSSLAVVDVNSNLVGSLVGIDPQPRLSQNIGGDWVNTRFALVYKKDLNLILTYNLLSGLVDDADPVTTLSKESSLYFQAPDCSGGQYVNGLNYPYLLVTMGPYSERTYFKADGYSDVVGNLVYNSIQHGTTATSTCETITGTLLESAKVHQIQKPDFQGPLSIID